MKARDQRVFGYVTRASRRNSNKGRQVGMKENVQANKQQATTVDSKALTSSECAHESAGPTSIRVRHKSEQANSNKGRQAGMKVNVQASQQQATTVDSKALTSSECAHESAGPTSIRVHHKSEQAKQQQAKTGRYEGERTSEPAISNNRGPKGTDIVRMRS